jgi:hypothetical protein
MKLFSKSVDTKHDHLAGMKSVIRDAIDAALKAGVPPAAIHQDLASRAADFERAEQRRIEARQYNPLPQMYDALTLKPIDAHGEARRAEEKRTADDLRRQQAEYARSVDERGRAEARRLGEIL